MKGPILSLAVLLCSASAFAQVAQIALPRVTVYSAHPAHNRRSVSHLPPARHAFSIGVENRPGATLSQLPWIFGQIPWNESLSSQACQVLNATSDQDPSPVPGDDPRVLNPKQCTEVISAGRQTQLGSAISNSDPSAIRAYTAVNEVLKYYATMFGFFGLDGRGTPVSAVIHAGKHYDNAFWDPDLQAIVFGDGNPTAKAGEKTGDYTAALDVVGHEMTHGVISKIVDQGKGLPGSDENGALNEGCSDIMGVLINRKAIRASGTDPDQDHLDGKPWSWTFGHGVYLETLALSRKRANETAFRSLVNPSSRRTRNGRDQVRAFPNRYSSKITSAHGDANHEACTPTNDFCAVHANATIPGHAAYLFATGLAALVQELPSLQGRVDPNPASLESAQQKAEDFVARVTFMALKTHVSSEEKFPGWAMKMVQTCNEFHPSQMITSRGAFVPVSIFERDLICGVLVSALQKVELLKGSTQVRGIR